jgi:hypothetical protein
MKKQAFTWTDRACLPLMTVVATVTTALNYYFRQSLGRASQRSPRRDAV